MNNFLTRNVETLWPCWCILVLFSCITFMVFTDHEIEIHGSGTFTGNELYQNLSFWERFKYFIKGKRPDVLDTEDQYVLINGKRVLYYYEDNAESSSLNLITFGDEQLSAEEVESVKKIIKEKSEEK